MCKYLITMVFIFSITWLNAQRRYNPDSLQVALRAAKTDTDRIRTLIEIGDIYRHHTDIQVKLDSADFFIKQALQLNKRLQIVRFRHRIDLLIAESLQSSAIKPALLKLIEDCKRTGDKHNESLAWNALADASNYNSGSYAEMLTYYQRGLALSKQVEDTHTEWKILINMAIVHVVQGNLNLGEKELLLVTKESKKAGAENLMNAHNCLSFLYAKRGAFDKALLYALMTERGMEITGDSSSAFAFRDRIEYVYNMIGKLDLSLKWSKKGLAHIIATKNYGTLFSCSLQIVNVLIKQKKAGEALAFITGLAARYPPKTLDDKCLVQMNIGRCYADLKKYALAERSYLQMMKFVKQQGDALSIDTRGDGYASMGNLYFATGKFEKAKYYFTAALKDFERWGSAAYVESLHQRLFRADSALGNYPLAIKHLQLYSQLRDSMFNISKNKQIEELQIKYQTTEREKDFKLVQGRERLGQVTLQSTQNSRNWIIAGSCLLLIIAALLFRQNKLKQKNYQVVAQKNELLQNLITEKQEANKAIIEKNTLLQKLVLEKEWLVKEVHHRVKNNLHSVICLLEAQTAHLENDALKAIEESQHRIYTMSLIHQKLYQSEDIQTIDMAVYIPELTEYLSDSFDVSNRILFKIRTQSINLPASKAIPLGLILNEALTNSIKYAFPDDRMGEISISLTGQNSQYKMILSDNGIGIVKEEKTKKQDSMGLRLIRGLTKEIGGKILMKNNPGFKITILFEVEDLFGPMSSHYYELPASELT